MKNIQEEFLMQREICLGETDSQRKAEVCCRQRRSEELEVRRREGCGFHGLCAIYLDTCLQKMEDKQAAFIKRGTRTGFSSRMITLWLIREFVLKGPEIRVRSTSLVSFVTVQLGSSEQLIRDRTELE